MTKCVCVTIVNKVTHPINFRLSISGVLLKLDFGFFKSIGWWATFKSPHKKTGFSFSFIF